MKLQFMIFYIYAYYFVPHKLLMIIKIKIDEESSLTFDTTDLPKDSDFDSLFQIIKESGLPSSSKFKIAYAYKNEYFYCKKILDHIKTTNLRDIKSKAEIFQMSLDLTHNNPIIITEEHPYNSYYILLGYENIRTKSYSRALVYFTKCQYKLGIELCNFYLKKPYNFTNETLRAINIYNTKDIVNHKIATEMLKRNVSVEYYNGTLKDNIDTKLSVISKDLDKIDLYKMDNDYFYYLKGKREHLKKNYDKAIEYYKMSLDINNNIYAKYNLLRILQNDCINEDFDCYEYNNFKYFMKYKKCKNDDIKCNVTNINTDIKNFINIITGIKHNPESYITKYKSLLENKLVDRDIIRNNLIYFKYSNTDKEVQKEDIEMLKNIHMRTNSPYVKYNLFYLTRDETFYDPNNKFSTQIYNFVKHGELEHVSIYDKLIKAKTVKDYENCLESFYGANGLGICLAKSLKYQEALKIFYSLVLDYNDVYVNIGNVYILMKKYEKGFTEYLKVYDRHTAYVQNMIKKHYKIINNIDLLIKIYNLTNIIVLKGYIFELLLNSNRLKEAELYKVEDEFLLNLYNKKTDEEKNKQMELKRKIQELESYKKSKNLK